MAVRERQGDRADPVQHGIVVGEHIGWARLHSALLAGQTLDYAHVVDNADVQREWTDLAEQVRDHQFPLLRAGFADRLRR